MIQPAKAEDAVALVALRDGIATWLLSRGVRQWLPGEFELDRMRTWIDVGAVHVFGSDDTIVAAVAVLWDDVDLWGADDGQAGYVHLLMVARSAAGQGLGNTMLRHAEQAILDSGRAVARLDAVASNPMLQAWYGERGYRPVGTSESADPEVFDTVLMEKPLTVPPPDPSTDAEVGDRAARFFDEIATWAVRQPDVRAVGVAGSWARGTATAASDIDLVIIVDALPDRIDDPAWLSELGEVDRAEREDWGRVQAWRAWYATGLEVEFGLTTHDWVDVPLDTGTAAVVADGFRVLYDPAGSMTAALRIVQPR